MIGQTSTTRERDVDSCGTAQVSLNMQHKGELVLILTRGLPSCGKSTRAKELGKEGATVIEFDEYFYTHVGSNPDVFNWRDDRRDDARAWFRDRVLDAVADGVTPIVADSDNNPSRFMLSYVEPALDAGYRVEICEPQTPWWATIRSLLDNPEQNKAELETWAIKLAGLSLSTHRVSAASMIRRMNAWSDVRTVEDLLDCAQRGKVAA